MSPRSPVVPASPADGHYELAGSTTGYPTISTAIEMGRSTSTVQSPFLVAPAIIKLSSLGCMHTLPCRRRYHDLTLVDPSATRHLYPILLQYADDNAYIHGLSCG